MEVSTAHPPAVLFDNSSMELSTYDMDIDMDIDISGADLEVSAVEAEAMNIEPSITIVPSNSSLQPNDLVNTSQEPVPQKVHIRGLDNLATEDIKVFALEHFPAGKISRIDWIDDTSANIVYETSEISAQALAAFSSCSEEELVTLTSLHLRAAKPLNAHPNSQLYVRQATAADVKRPHASEVSRFYLLHPDKDPRDRRNRFDTRRSRRDGYDERRYPGQKEKEKDKPFDVNMYDDDSESLAARITFGKKESVSRSGLVAGDESRRVKRVRLADDRNGDLFKGRLSRAEDDRLRDRSASPNRVQDGDGRYGFEENELRPQSIRQRSLTPRAHTYIEPLRKNAGRELLAPTTNGRSGVLQASMPSTRRKELFPDKSTSMKSESNKELSPRKGSTHRRTDAFDAADESADLKPRSLADRISGGPQNRRSKSIPTLGRVEVEESEQLEGFTIRGAARETAGFSIRGAAQSESVTSVVKELFPPSSEMNSGKELFGGGLAGKRGPRRKAEDMFG